MTKTTLARRIIGTVLVLIVLGLTTCGTFMTSVSAAQGPTTEIAGYA